MKRSTTTVTLIFVCVLVAVVGYYTYLTGRSRENQKEAVLSEVQLVLSRDLKNDYPPTPKEVIRYYNEVTMCFYNEECTDQEIEALANKARQLYDGELLANNEPEAYLVRLKQEIADGKEAGMKITSASVASSTNVDYFKEDGYEFARIHCGYTVIRNSVSTPVREVYLLRRDENRQWKIYGWELAENLDSQDSQ